MKCRNCDFTPSRPSGKIVRKCPKGDLCQFEGRRGLGDWLADMLARVGITKARWSHWRSQGVVCGGMNCYLVRPAARGESLPCGCQGRQEALNKAVPF